MPYEEEIFKCTFSQCLMPSFIIAIITIILVVVINYYMYTFLLRHAKRRYKVQSNINVDK